MLGLPIVTGSSGLKIITITIKNLKKVITIISKIEL